MPKLQPAVQPTKQAPLARPLALRLTALGDLLGTLLQPCPAQWLGANTGLKNHATMVGGMSESPSLTLRTCESYSELVRAWRKAMKWSEGLDTTLSVMLASSMSTQFLGEQLWIKIIGPPSCGKTSLMEGLATARKWYLSKDTIRGFHSGYKTDDGKDVSLAQMVKGMTLGTKDGDTLLKAPNLKQILAEGRALYDKVSRTNYRNDVNREYTGHRMTWHLAGTSALREIDDSELGARFLDVVVMDKIEDEFEDEVGWRAANQEARNMLYLSDGKPESQHPEELAEAMALTGGYLDFLRVNALELARAVKVEESVLNQCNKFGKFTAFMRARAGRDGENAEREFSARLVKQLTRLAISQAVVLNKEVVDDEVLARVHKVVIDTSRGHTLDLMRVLSPMRQGCEVRAMTMLCNSSEDKMRLHLRFLRRIGIVETDVNHRRWRVVPRFNQLYSEVDCV